MSFTTAALSSHSERFFLVTMRPRKLLGVGTFVSSGTYTYDLTLDRVDEVQIADAVHADWTYSGGVLTITSAPDLTLTTTYPVTVDHDIFLTGTKTRETNGVSDVPDAIWQPLITTYPKFQQTMRNIAEGVFSISNTEIEVITTDRWVQENLGENDSFAQAPVTVWACIDSVDNNKVIFTGEVARVYVKNGRANFTVLDTFQTLQNTALFGDRFDAFVIRGSVNTPNSNVKDQFKPIPIVFGRTSPFKIQPGWRHVDPYDQPAVKTYSLAEGIPLTRVDPDNPSMGSNISYLAARFVGTGLFLMSFGTTVRAAIHYVAKSLPNPDNSGLTDIIYDILYYFNFTSFNGEIGDYIPGYGFVSGKGTTFSFMGQDYNTVVTFITNSPQFPVGPPTSGPIATPTLPNTTYPSYSLWYDRGETVQYNYFPNTLGLGGPYYQAVQDRRYIPASGISIVSQNTYAGQPMSMVYFDVDSDEVGDITSVIKCRFTPNQAVSQAQAMEMIVSASGLDANAASFAQAATDLNAGVIFTIPKLGSSAHGTYLEAAEDVARSALGLLKVNAAREVEYEIISDPQLATPDATRSRVDMVQGDTVAVVEYQDVASQVVFDNPHHQGLEALSNVSGPKASFTNPRLKQLHRSDKVKEITHVLDNVFFRADAIAGYHQSPTVEYSLSTASKDLVTELGDVTEVDNKSVADSGTVRAGLVTEVTSSGGKTGIKINEIRGII